MWIRSQDKKILANVNEIWVVSGNIRGNNTSTADSFLNLGDYKIEERAIEVLNDIQDQLTKCNERIVNFNYDYANYSNTTYSEKSNVVYQIP